MGKVYTLKQIQLLNPDDLVEFGAIANGKKPGCTCDDASSSAPAEWGSKTLSTLIACTRKPVVRALAKNWNCRSSLYGRRMEQPVGVGV